VHTINSGTFPFAAAYDGRRSVFFSTTTLPDRIWFPQPPPNEAVAAPSGFLVFFLSLFVLKPCGNRGSSSPPPYRSCTETPPAAQNDFFDVPTCVAEDSFPPFPPPFPFSTYRPAESEFPPPFPPPRRKETFSRPLTTGWVAEVLDLRVVAPPPDIVWEAAPSFFLDDDARGLRFSPLGLSLCGE